MRSVILACFASVILQSACAQTRAFASVGAYRSAAGFYDAPATGLRPTIELYLETRVTGSLYFVYGLSYLNLSHEYEEDLNYETWLSYISDGPMTEMEIREDFGGLRREIQTSRLQSRHLIMPFALRYNHKNRNQFLLDFRLSPTWMMYAHLEETYETFLLPDSYWSEIYDDTYWAAEDKGIITPYTNPFGLMIGMEMSYGIKRFILSINYQTINIDKGSRPVGFLEEWDLEKNESTYFYDIEGYFYALTGFRLSYRIR